MQIRLYLILAVLAWPLIGQATVPLDGYLIAAQNCPAYHSFHKETNPGNIALITGMAYEVIGKNKQDASHYLIAMPSHAEKPQPRWVAISCGKLLTDCTEKAPLESSATPPAPITPPSVQLPPASFQDEIANLESAATSSAMVAPASIQPLTELVQDDTQQRTITIKNQCPFDVWMDSAGGNASVIPCSPEKDNAQANCRIDHICYSKPKPKNINYCVPGTVANKHAEASNKNEITLNPAACKSKKLVTDTGSNSWGQCTCHDDSDCAKGQSCKQAAAGIKQCYWQYPFKHAGKIEGKGGTLSLDIPIHNQQAGALVANGKFYSKLSCDINQNCRSDMKKNTPTSLVEFTLKNDNDWYDVSYINGVNIPMAMYPVPDKDNDYQQDDPYRCQAAGGTPTIYNQIIEFQRKNNGQPNTELQDFACTYDYEHSFVDANTGTGFNFVSEEKNAVECKSTETCKDSKVCGLTLKTVLNGKTQTHCGHRLGYWTYAQFCSVPVKKRYNNETLGISCDVLKNYAYALCKKQSHLSTGASQSCFNASTGENTCCGYQHWAKGDSLMPMGQGSKIYGTSSTTWRSEILPKVAAIKQGCHLAYAYQYDDPFSTFTCASKGTLNKVNYQIDLCPDGKTAGVNPPPPPVCKASVPSAYPDNSFTISPPAKHSIAVYQCAASDENCETSRNKVMPSQTNIYAAKKGIHTYQVTLIKGSNNESVMSCKFKVPYTACITPVSKNNACKNWILDYSGPWAGRSIGPSVP